MSLEANKAISRRWFEEGYGRGNTAVLTELGEGEWVETSALGPQIERFHEGFPDLAVTIEEQIAEGDRVVTRAVFTGTHTGDLMGVAPTGKPIDQGLVEIHTIANGKIVAVWNDFHPVSILAQIGAIKPPD